MYLPSFFLEYCVTSTTKMSKELLNPKIPMRIEPYLRLMQQMQYLIFGNKLIFKLVPPFPLDIFRLTKTRYFMHKRDKMQLRRFKDKNVFIV